METKEYERLVSAYLDNIYRVAVNGCKNYADAEDVVQNTFIKLLEREETFEDDDYARKWLIRVAVNECNSFWRSPWKLHTVSIEEMNQEPVFSTPEKSDLYYAIRELPAKYRQIVHLYYYEDYSTKEIAQITKLSETAVQTRLMRARQKIKEKLKEDGYE